MNEPLSGKVALVTGGSRGIGATVVLTLARQGADVAFTHVGDAESAAGVARQAESLGRRAVAFEADAADFARAEEVVGRVVAELHRLDVLVCNAGITRDGVVWSMTEAQWDKVLDVNLKGTFNYCRAAARVMKEKRTGKIVNVSSINGIRGKFGQANYAASKAGMIALTKSLAKELGKFDVNVNAVAPGMVMTEMAEAIPANFLNAAVKETVLGRLATTQDVANVVAFLCSDAARHVTGEVIKVDGGQYI